MFLRLNQRATECSALRNMYRLNRCVGNPVEYALLGKQQTRAMGQGDGALSTRLQAIHMQHRQWRVAKAQREECAYRATARDEDVNRGVQGEISIRAVELSIRAV